ncbi:protein TIME FOR COFFEE-like isoform X2 [Trifolium pratense]|uniref:protein TIME FOR COFFEE-like isoform X2 n=1 Tax=Trifolium pratense TaxID=57577 RepID=UPI001E692F8E|nr:protein TIME FOR COFFEE-like isoform X2 [Trifolium pratense]
MDKTRRSSIASINGFLKRKHRNITLRDSSEEETVELKEVPSKRGRNHDRDSLNRSKRRRSSHSYGDEGERSTEERFGNELDDHARDAGLSRICLPNTTSFVSDQNHRRKFTPAKSPPLKRTDEMIGVVVPRKARSASVKRTQESWISGGGGEKQIFRVNSPGRRSIEPSASPSKSVSVQQNMKATGEVGKTSELSSSEMEIEIAELLYGLRTSKNHDSSSQKVEPTINHNTSTDAEKNKSKDCNSTEELARVQGEKPAGVGSHHGNATCHEKGSSEVPKEDIGEDKVNSGAGFGGDSADGRPLSTTWGLQSCSNLEADKQDSASTREMSIVPEDKTQRVGKFDIDLMAPPPTMLSPKGNDLSRGNLTSEIKKLAPDLEMSKASIKVEDKVEMLVTVEKVPEEIEDTAKMAVFKDKLDVLKHYLEMPNNDIKINNKLEEQDRYKEQPTALSNPKMEKIDHSSSAPLSAVVSGPPSSLSPIGSMIMIGRYTPPLQTAVKTSKTTGSSTTTQHVDFALSESQPKRCATHYRIARNILHQKFTKMNPLLPAIIGSGSLCATKTNNVNCLISAESMVVNKQSQKHLPSSDQSSDQNGTQEKGLAATGDHNLTATKGSNYVNPVHKMQFVLQQGPQPGSTGNLVHGPAFLFSQASVAAATNQAGGVNSPNNASSYNRSQSSVAGSPCTSSTLPAAATAMSFSYPQFSANNSPYATIVHNNGYSFPISTNSLGATAAIRGASSAQTTHILGGPLHSSQIFHPLQHPQQHPHLLGVQPSYLTAQTSSSSSSHMQSHGAQLNGNNILNSTSAERQSQKQQTLQSRPHKQETEVNEKNVTSVANLTSYPLKNLQGQNYTIPVQPVNFSFKPCATSDIVGGNSGNFGDKQQQVSKGGVEVVPSQAFAVSFASFNGTNLPSNLNFSSMKQNPLVIQSLPDVARQGYQTASAPHNVQQKTCSITVEKRGGNSSHQDDEKKTTHGKSSTNGPTTLVFDNSSKNINFVLSHSNGCWPSHSVASTVITTMPFSSNTSSSQQSSQLLQLQKQHGVQQHQHSTANRNKASSTNTASATKFANNVPVLLQSHSQCKSSNQTSHSKITGRTTGSHVHHTSSITSKTPTTKNVSEKGRFSQGHMQISFGGDYTTSLPPEVQHQLNNSQHLCTKAAGPPFNGGNLKPNSEGWKIDSSANISQLQQPENSSAGSSQKSSPVCGRNVPSILSSGLSHLSELN